MLKTYKYKLYPTKAQKRQMSETLFACSLVYNRCLAQRKESWEKEQRSISSLEQIKQLPTLKKEDERYQSVHSQVLQDAVRRVDKTFQNFFRRVKRGQKAGYPRFKSARRYDSFSYPQSGFKLGKKLTLSKIGDVKVKFHRRIEGKIRTLTIHRQADGWFACFCCEVENQLLPPTGKSVGVDVGLENFVTTSDGEFFPPIKALRKSEKKVKVAQRAVSRRKKGSRRRGKAVWRLRRTHQRVSNKRRDMHHKVAGSLVKRYDVIAIEDLSTSKMVKNHHLAKSIIDSGWTAFSIILTAKAEGAGRRIVRVDPKYTSQVCSGCGGMVKKSLWERWHSCGCGTELHRDVNAAINIRNKMGSDRAFVG
jgi:putative transposase